MWTQVGPQYHVKVGTLFARERGNISRSMLKYREYLAHGRYSQLYLVGGSRDAAFWIHFCQKFEGCRYWNCVACEIFTGKINTIISVCCCLKKAKERLGICTNQCVNLISKLLRCEVCHQWWHSFTCLPWLQCKPFLITHILHICVNYWCARCQKNSRSHKYRVSVKT